MDRWFQLQRVSFGLTPWLDTPPHLVELEGLLEAFASAHTVETILNKNDYYHYKTFEQGTEQILMLSPVSIKQNHGDPSI